MSHEYHDLVITDLADDLAAVREDRDAFRELTHVAIGQLAEQRRILDQQALRLRDQARQINELLGTTVIAEESEAA